MKNLLFAVLLSFMNFTHADAGVTRRTFEDLGADIVHLYEAEALEKNWYLTSVPLWDKAEINANLSPKNAPFFDLFYYGGLIKKAKLSKDSLSIVLCHEMGHLFGKRIPGEEGPFSTAPEGEADYFATQNCIKRLWVDVTDADGEIPASEEVNLTKRLIKLGFKNNSRDFLLARRMAKASYETLNKIISARNISFAREDKSKVSGTLVDYPSVQCRLDTYLAGIANKKRPSCWYK